ncbi:MAG: hypothetical protein PHW56_05595 [Methanosarcinaceae archaeon]|nr:hypothetical protein [Methanosarcinaceae archaeon]
MVSSIPFSGFICIEKPGLVRQDDSGKPGGLELIISKTGTSLIVVFPEFRFGITVNRRFTGSCDETATSEKSLIFLLVAL